DVSIQTWLVAAGQPRRLLGVAQAIPAAPQGPCRWTRSGMLSLVPFHDAHEQTALVQAMKEDTAWLSSWQLPRRPVLALGFVRRPVHDMELHTAVQRKVIHCLTVTVGHFHDHPEQRVAVTRQMLRPGKGLPKLIHCFGRQAHAAVMNP